MLLHFGCRPATGLGHYLTYPDGREVRERDYVSLLIPGPGLLDGSRLFLPRPERPGTGALTYLSAPDRTILAWWGSALDPRPGANQALLAEGCWTDGMLWAAFQHQFPDVAPAAKPTLIDRGDERLIRSFDTFSADASV